MPSPRRKEKRIRLKLPIYYADSAQVDGTLNVGPGGLFILAAHPFPVGTKLRFHFGLPDVHLRIETSGTVVWTPVTGSRHPTGMGIRLDENQGDVQDLLGLYVDVEREIDCAFAALETPSLGAPFETRPVRNKP